MDKKIYQKIQQFKKNQQKIENLEAILKDERKNLESQSRRMYKSVLGELNMIFRNSKTPFAKVMLHGTVTDGCQMEDFCGDSPIKNFSWRLSQFLIGLERDWIDFNTNSIEDFIFTQKEVDELNEKLSEKLGISFTLTNDCYFNLTRK